MQPLLCSSLLAQRVTGIFLLQGIPSLSEKSKSLSLISLSDFQLNLFKVEGFRYSLSFAPLFCLLCEHRQAWVLSFRTHELFQAGTELRLSLLSVYLEQKD